MLLRSIIVFRHDFTKVTWSIDPPLSASETFKIDFVIFDNIKIALII